MFTLGSSHTVPSQIFTRTVQHQKTLPSMLNRTTNWPSLMTSAGDLSSGCTWLSLPIRTWSNLCSLLNMAPLSAQFSNMSLVALLNSYTIYGNITQKIYGLSLNSLHCMNSIVNFHSIFFWVSFSSNFRSYEDYLTRFLPYQPQFDRQPDVQPYFKRVTPEKTYVSHFRCL